MHKLPYQPHKLVVLVDKSKHDKLKKRLKVHEDVTVSDSVRDYMDKKLDELPSLPNEL